MRGSILPLILHVSFSHRFRFDVSLSLAALINAFLHKSVTASARVWSLIDIR
jgi:hypothetical protein